MDRFPFEECFQHLRKMDALERFSSIRNSLSTLSEHNFDFRYPEISRMFRIQDPL